VDESFIEGIGQQASHAYKRTGELRYLRGEYEREYGHEKTATDRLAMRLFEQPYVTARTVANMLNVTQQTACNPLTELEESGVLEKTTGRERYREHKAVDIYLSR